MNKMSRDSFGNASAGIVMVELAIILPLLLFLLFGITELGRALYQQNMLTQAVESGGRYLARVEGAVDSDTCDEGSRWDDAVLVATNLITCGVDAGCGTPILPNLVVDDPEVIENTLSLVSACVITVKATANFQSIFGEDLVNVSGYRLVGPLQLNATTQERYIGY